MHTKAKNRLIVILILISFLVISIVSITAIFAITQQSIETEVGVEYDTPENVVDISFLDVLDRGDGWVIIGCDAAAEGIVIIPKTLSGIPVVEIGDSAFSECNKLKKVIIQEGVTAIGNSAFSGCVNLTNVEISGDVTSIGDSAFKNCAGLASIVIPSSVTEIGINAFSGCTELSGVYFKDTEGWFVADSADETSGNNLNSEILSTPAAGATYLKEAYNNKYWKKTLIIE